MCLCYCISIFFLMIRRPPRFTRTDTLLPYTALFRSRHGGIRAPQFRGGGKAFGPVPHSHAIDLPKKVRKLALKTALSTKLAEGKLKVVSDAVLKDAKTKGLAGQLKGLGLDSALLIDGKVLDENVARAASSLRTPHMLPERGAPVPSILRRHTLVPSQTPA